MRRRIALLGLGLALVAVAAGRVALRRAPGPDAGPAVTAAVTPPDAPGGGCTVARVIDGDTLDVVCGGTADRVRLLRIDTPERGRPGYRGATAALAGLVLGAEVRLEPETPGVPERDRYGRLLAYVFAGGRNVNVEMVRAGWSRFWTRYGEGRFAAEFERAERQARRVAAPPAAPDCLPRAGCCRVCSRGKACGDSCISRSSTCRKSPGCACDAAEVCP